MDYESFKQCVMKEADNASITEYDLYYEKKSERTVEIYKDEVKAFSTVINAGVSFRCIINGKTGCASTELFTEESAKELVSHAAENGKSIESEDKVYLNEGGDKYEESLVKTGVSPSSKEMTDTAFQLINAAYGENEKVIDGTQSQVQSLECTIELCNSRGISLSHTYNMDIACLLTIISDGGEMYDSDEYEINQLWNIEIGALASSGVRKALEKRNPVKIESGKYDVVFSGHMMATILRTFAPVFSGEEIQRGLSLLGNKEGQKIAGDCITLVDDPFYKNSPLQIPFDAEGVPAYTKHVIEKGRLKTVLHNMKTGEKAGVKSTGNGLKQKYSLPITIMPFHFYLKPGIKKQEELFMQAKEGIYITSLQGMHSGANSSTGDFSLAAGGFLIKDGKKAEAVKGFTVSGNFYDLLMNIKEAAADLSFLIPKGLSVYGSPSVLAKDLSIAGE